MKMKHYTSLIEEKSVEKSGLTFPCHHAIYVISVISCHESSRAKKFVDYVNSILENVM